MKAITKVFLRLLMATLSIFLINALEPIFHFTLSLNIFNILIISIFDVFGLILCIVLKLIL